MLRRCYYPKHASYPKWGGRGIRVCDKWRTSFAAFLAYVGPRPTPKHTLGRLDNNGHYEPGNVAWQTRIEQGKDRSNSVRVTAFGKTMIVADWARELGVHAESIRGRLRRGLTGEAALTRRRA